MTERISMTSAPVAPESEELSYPRLVPGPGDPWKGIFLTNRCKGCGRAITKLEVIHAFEHEHNVCPCGSNSFKSTNFKWWEALLLVRSWRCYRAWRRGEISGNPSPKSVADLRRSMIRQVIELEEAESNLVLPGAPE